MFALGWKIELLVLEPGAAYPERDARQYKTIYLLEPGWCIQRCIAINSFLEPGAAYPESNTKFKQLKKLISVLEPRQRTQNDLAKIFTTHVLIRRWPFGYFSSEGGRYGLRVRPRCLWQWSQNVGADGPHRAPMWEHTQSSAPCRCVPTSSLRFHAVGCWAKIENYVSVDFVSKWREPDDKFKITKYII